jgi:hypothetical protein
VNKAGVFQDEGFARTVKETAGVNIPTDTGQIDGDGKRPVVAARAPVAVTIAESMRRVDPGVGFGPALNMAFGAVHTIIMVAVAVGSTWTF